MTEQGTNNTRPCHGTICDKCGHQQPLDEPYNGGGEIPRVSERNKGVEKIPRVSERNKGVEKIPRVSERNKVSKLLGVLGMVALLEGFFCLVAAYLDHTLGDVLPTDPFSILGVACIVAGVLLIAGGLFTYLYPRCKDQTIAKDRSKSVEHLLVDHMTESGSISTPTSDSGRVDVIESSEDRTDNKKDR